MPRDPVKHPDADANSPVERQVSALLFPMTPLDAAAIAVVCLWFIGLLLMTWLFFFFEYHGESYPLRILRARSNPRLVRANA